MKWLIVRGLENACHVLDVLFRDFGYIHCRFLVRWSYTLDERWHTGAWRRPDRTPT